MIYPSGPSSVLTKDRTFMTRITRMTLIQSIITTHDHIVTNVIDLFIIVLSGFDVDVGKGEVPAWLGF
jgi:hypothetical protein